MNEPNQIEPWAAAIIEKHRTAMLGELKREYVQRNLVEPFVRQVMADLDRIASAPATKPVTTADAGSQTK